MSKEEERPAIVIENGSGSMKSGFAGEEQPDGVFPSVVGRISRNLPSDFEDAGYVVKNVVHNALEVDRRDIDLTYPIEHGIVKNWDDMESLWFNAFYNVMHLTRETIDQHNHLLIDSPLSSKGQREKMTQIMFETFHVPKLYIAEKGKLSIYASGRGTAINVHCGDGVIHVVPIYEGCMIRNAVKRVDFGGRDITEYLMKLLSESGYSFSTPRERELVRYVKQQHCYVAQDYQHELTMATERKIFDFKQTCQTIMLGKERFQCAEALFNPSLVGESFPGVHQLVHDALMECDIDTRKDFYVNIVLSGGTTLFPGFPERLHRELEALKVGLNLRCKVIATPEREYNVWIGGSILGSLSMMDNLWITKQEYQEYGPNIVHKKCL